MVTLTLFTLFLLSLVALHGFQRNIQEGGPSSMSPGVLWGYTWKGFLAILIVTLKPEDTKVTRREILPYWISFVSALGFLTASIITLF